MEVFSEFFSSGISLTGIVVALVAGVLFFVVRPMLKKRMNLKVRPEEQLSQPLERLPEEVEIIPVTKVKGDIKPNKTGSFRVVVLRTMGIFGNPSITFERLDKPAGNLMWAEPSLAESGMTYMIKEKADGTFEAYDPRLVALISEQTPQMAYFATHWEIVQDVFMYVRSLWDQISPWLVWVMVFVFFIIALVALD